jgi:hypothetical protein
MDVRFRTSSAAGPESGWSTIGDLLDALEIGTVSPDDFVFDAIRQSWQPLRSHGEIAAAWRERMRFRPADAPLPFLPPPADGFPALSPEGITPIGLQAVQRPVVPPTARDADPRHPWLTVAAGAGLMLVIAVMLVLLVGAGRFLVGTVRLAS